jgi:hypothetical protein
MSKYDRKVEWVQLNFGKGVEGLLRVAVMGAPHLR